MRSLDSVTGAYGQDWDTGVLAEHLHDVEAVLKVAGSGRLYAYERVAGRLAFAVPVLCGEIVEIYTEDGKIDGRCGLPVHGIDGFACPGHQAGIEAYRSNPDDYYEDESF